VETKGTERTGDYAFFYGKRKENYQLGTGLFVYNGIVSAVKSAELISERRSFEKAGAFKYLGTILTNQNSIQEEIKLRLQRGNACHHSVQNLLSSN